MISPFLVGACFCELSLWVWLQAERKRAISANTMGSTFVLVLCLGILVLYFVPIQQI